MMEKQAPYTEITALQLKSWVDQGLGFLLVDTLPEDHYKKQHLPGAKNACVYEVVFLQNMKNLIQSYAGPLVLYGSSSASRDALTAAEKLARTGYRDLYVLIGGLRAWLEAGYRLEGEAPEERDTWLAKGRLSDGNYQVDLEASFVGWTGRNANVGHHGMVRLKAGELSIRNGIISGTFVLDMDSIVNFNLQDEALRKILIDHLRSDDFFFVERFPEASFSVVRAQPIVHARPGSVNYEVEGKLNLRGIDGDLVFEAVIENLADGAMAAEAHFDLDRTRWGVIYGSGRFFEHLGMHLVYDPVSIQVRIVAR
jgi:polyisoprenoid-binding protein YceI